MILIVNHKSARNTTVIFGLVGPTRLTRPAGYLQTLLDIRLNAQHTWVVLRVFLNKFTLQCTSIIVQLTACIWAARGFFGTVSQAGGRSPFRLRATSSAGTCQRFKLRRFVCNQTCQVSRNFRESPEMEHDLQPGLTEMSQNLTEFKEFD